MVETVARSKIEHLIDDSCKYLGNAAPNWPITTFDSLLILERAGFAISVNRLFEIGTELGLPMAADIREMKWERTDVIRFAEACNRKRWWVPTARQHDPRRTTSELVEALQLTDELRHVIYPRCQELNVHQLLMLLYSEEDLELRRAYRNAIGCQLSRDHVQ